MRLGLWISQLLSIQYVSCGVWQLLCIRYVRTPLGDVCQPAFAIMIVADDLAPGHQQPWCWLRLTWLWPKQHLDKLRSMGVGRPATRRFLCYRRDRVLTTKALSCIASYQLVGTSWCPLHPVLSHLWFIHRPDLPAQRRDTASKPWCITLNGDFVPVYKLYAAVSEKNLSWNFLRD